MGLWPGHMRFTENLQGSFSYLIAESYYASTDAL